MSLRAVIAAVSAALLSSCGAFIEYTDGLRNSEEHTVVVRGTAKVGGAIGLLAGVPISVVALPASYTIYKVQESGDPEGTDYMSTVAFPAFALLEVCSLLATPFDVLEMALYRAWLPAATLTAEEQLQLEFGFDDQTLPRYPVTRIYPIDR